MEGEYLQMGGTSGHEARLRDSRREDVEGWIVLRQCGRPYELGFQNGWWLAGEIRDELRRLQPYVKAACPGYDWTLFREAAETLYWPRLDERLREELRGVADGMKARGEVGTDLVDIVALNGYVETLYSYHPWLEYGGRSPEQRPLAEEQGGCSAFVATGSYTVDGRPVLAHSTWFAYITAGWQVLRAVFPDEGIPFLAQSNPGTVHSGTDFYFNQAGLAVAETTITGVYTFRPEGRPNFARSREAIQYAGSIDEWVARISRDSNGGVANDWLLFDATSGEIAQVELGTNAMVLERTKDGVFVGSNLALHDAVRRETSFDYDDAASSPCARRTRWLELVESERGRIDGAAARRYLADHRDVRTGTDHPSRTTLCGHVESEETGLVEWGWGSLYPGGALDGKVVDAAGCLDGGRFSARYGKPCGAAFDTRLHLRATRAYEWESVFPDFRLEPHGWIEREVFV